jgi:hypothetical protein
MTVMKTAFFVIPVTVANLLDISWPMRIQQHRGLNSKSEMFFE